VCTDGVVLMNQMHLDFSKQQLPNLSYALNGDEEPWQARVESGPFDSDIKNESLVIEKETLKFFSHFQDKARFPYKITYTNYIPSESQYNRHEPDFKIEYKGYHPIMFNCKNKFYIEQKWNPRVFFTKFDYHKLEYMIDKVNFDHYKRWADKEQCEVFIHLVTPVYSDDLIFNVHDVQCIPNGNQYKIPVSHLSYRKSKYAWMGVSNDGILSMDRFVNTYMGINPEDYWDFYKKLHSNINYIANSNKFQNNPQLIKDILKDNPTIQFKDKPR
jgi:hypothetical protein